MILVIRISGQVEIPAKVEESLYQLKLRRKYAAVLLKESTATEKILINLRNYVAYGKVSEESLRKLIELRGQPLKRESKIDAIKIIPHLGNKPMEELGLKPFFRLHPPRGGIESKRHFGVGKGVLGDNKENINKLMERML